MRLFPFAPYWMTDDYSTTTVNISSQENSVFLLFYWADCRSRFIKISPCKYLPCFKFLRPCKAKIYCYIYKRTCSGSNVLTVFWKIYTFHCFYSKFMWSRFHSTFTYKYSIGMQILQIFIIMGWIQHNSISYKACVTKDHRHWFFSFGGGGVILQDKLSLSFLHWRVACEYSRLDLRLLLATRPECFYLAKNSLATRIDAVFTGDFEGQLSFLSLWNYRLD